jgi:hypothetical protein
VVVSGSIDSDGQMIGLSLALVSGEGAKGTMTVHGVVVQLVVVRGHGYITTTAAGWRRIGGADGAAASALLAGRWLEVPTTGQFSALFKLTNQSDLFGRLLAPHGTFVSGPATTLDGQHVASVTNTNTGGTLYVATSGPPYPVEVTNSGSDRGTLLRISQENKPVRLAPPPNPISLPALGA